MAQATRPPSGGKWIPGMATWHGTVNMSELDFSKGLDEQTGGRRFPGPQISETASQSLKKVNDALAETYATKQLKLLNQEVDAQLQGVATGYRGVEDNTLLEKAAGFAAMGMSPEEAVQAAKAKTAFFNFGQGNRSETSGIRMDVSVADMMKVVQEAASKGQTVDVASLVAIMDAKNEAKAAQLMTEMEKLRTANQTGNKDDIVSQLTKLKELGVIKIGTEGENTSEVLKIKADIDRDNQKFIRDLRKDDKTYELAKGKLEHDQAIAELSLAEEKRRTNLIGGITKRIGAAVAQGLGSIDEKDVEGYAPEKKANSKVKQEPCPVCAQAGRDVKVSYMPGTKEIKCATCNSEFSVEQ